MNQQQTYWPVADQRFPWLTRDQINRIEQVTASYTGMDKLKIQQQLYQQAINQIKNQQVTEERFWAKNDMYCRSLDKDSKEKTTDQCSVRLEDLADIVKNKYNLNANTDTNTVINWVVKMAQDKNVDTNLLNKYLDSWDKEFLYEMGFEEKPEEWTDYLGLASAYFNPLWYIANKAWEYFFEHPAEISVWAAQSPWKRWYNLIGQWIDRAWKALAWKLEWTELADTVRQAAIDMFWEEEVKNYAMQKQQELKNWTAFNGRDATDIRTPLLWDKANSQATQVWETIWDIWTAIALSYPMAASLAPYMWINTASQAWRTLLLWSWQWALDMAAYEYWANQEIASPTELWVWAFLWSVAPFVPSISKWINSKYEEIMQSFRNSTKEKVWEELKQLFSKWIKPSSLWVKTTAAQEKIYDDALDAVESIIKNKNNLKFTNANWEVIEWQLPKNVNEFAQAIDQTKKEIYKEYSSIAKEVWDEVRVWVDELTEELLKIKNDKAALLWNPELEKAVNNWLKWLSEIDNLSVEQAQRKIQEINKKLDAFYKNPNPNDVSSSSVDALVKNKLSESLDNAIENNLWKSEQYASLKKAYSKLKTIEKDVNHRAIVSWRQSPNSLVDSIADISSMDSLIDILSWNPVWAVKALWKQALKKYIKNSNSSDNLVRKLFEKADKEIGNSGSLRFNKKSLEMPKNSEYNWIDLNPNQLENGYNWTNWTNQGRIEWNVMDWWTNWGMVQETSMTNGWTAQGWAWMVWEPIAVENWEDMVNISKDLQSKADRWLFMDVHSAEDYNWYKNFSNWNKSAAISVKPDWDIINFVSTEKWAWKPLMLKAIEQGWNKMDNYWVWLTRYYENFWFEPVARVKFNREYAPEWWNFEKWWEPDIYVMKHNGDSIDAVKSNYWKYTHKTPEELDNLPEMDYDTALSYRDALQSMEKSEDMISKFKWRSEPKDLDKAKKEFVEAINKSREKWWRYSYEYLAATKQKNLDAKKEYDNLIKWIAKDVDWNPVTAPLKDDTAEWLTRYLQKWFQKENWLDDVTDRVRGTVSVKDSEWMKKVKDWLENYAKKKWIKLEDLSFDDKFTEPTPLWYKDMSAIITTENWTKAELQINIPEIMVAKEWRNAIKMNIVTEKQYKDILKKAWVEDTEEVSNWMGHHLYEDWRKLDGKYKETWNIKYKNEADKLKEKSLKFYKKFDK